LVTKRKLDSLSNIYSAKNSIVGSLPSQLYKLHKLLELVLGKDKDYIFHNVLHSFVFSPLKFYDLFFLDDNDINGEIDSQLGNLHRLKTLSFGEHENKKSNVNF